MNCFLCLVQIWLGPTKAINAWTFQPYPALWFTRSPVTSVTPLLKLCRLHFMPLPRLGVGQKFKTNNIYLVAFTQQPNCLHSCRAFPNAQHCRVKTCFTTWETLTPIPILSPHQPHYLGASAYLPSDDNGRQVTGDNSNTCLQKYHIDIRSYS